MFDKGKMGAICFVLWGLLHVVGGGAILLALTDGPDAGYAVYSGSGMGYSALAGHVLSYFAYNLVWIAGLVVFIALRFNWRNNETALALNAGIILLIEVGLVLFLLIPGHVSLTEAAPGLILFIVGATLCGIACNSKPRTREV